MPVTKHSKYDESEQLKCFCYNNRNIDLSVSMGMQNVGRYEKRIFLEEKSFHYANQ